MVLSYVLYNVLERYIHEELLFLKHTSPCAHSVVVSVFVSGFLSSAVTAVITSIVCLLMKKRPQPKHLVIATTSPGLIYDDITETTERKEIVEITSNVAYASASN